MQHTDPPATTDNPPEQPELRWQGDIAAYAAWLIGMAALGYALVGDELTLRYAALLLVMIPVSITTVRDLIRFLRPRPVSDATAIFDGRLALADERQMNLSVLARARAGTFTMAAVALTGMSGFLLAPFAGVTVTTMEDWVALAMALPYALMGTYNVTLFLASRYYSRRS